MVAHAQDWPWSSVRAHLDGRDDELVRVARLLDRVGRFTDLIVPGAEPEAFAALRPAEGTGRPVGTDASGAGGALGPRWCGCGSIPACHQIRPSKLAWPISDVACQRCYSSRMHGRRMLCSSRTRLGHQTP
jgi:hypothetical protein